MKKRLLLLACAATLLVSLVSCSKSGKSSGTTAAKGSVAIFIPGVAAGSPTYEMLVSGAQKAVSEVKGAKAQVIEAGTNQGEWQERLTAVAATKAYEFIVTSNPAMPELCKKVAELYPEQKFIVLDGHLPGIPNIYTFRFNQMEQAFLAGHFAGLAATQMVKDKAAEAPVVGLIAGQEYPDMNKAIRPGFELGLLKANKNARVDFRVVGNWYDATKGAELASSMYDSGVRVILTIAGGANEGVVSEAKKRGTYVLWFDMNAYKQAPGVIIGCTEIRQEKAAYEKTKAALEGRLPFGTADVVGVKDGYVGFAFDDELFSQHVPEGVRKAQRALYDEMATGKLSMPMPGF